MPGLWKVAVVGAATFFVILFVGFLIGGTAGPIGSGLCGLLCLGPAFLASLVVAFLYWRSQRGGD